MTNMDLIEALRLDYQDTQNFIDKCDDHMFKIKNWALVTTSAVIAYSISSDKEMIVVANIFLVLVFLYRELIHKSFQDSAIKHSTDLCERIDRAIQGLEGDEPESNYQFGFGRRLLYPSLRQCWKILRNRNRWHILSFYVLIAVFSIGAYVLGRYSL